MIRKIFKKKGIFRNFMHEYEHLKHGTNKSLNYEILRFKL